MGKRAHQPWRPPGKADSPGGAGAKAPASSCRPTRLQAPRRTLKAYFSAWHESVAFAARTRDRGVAVLVRMERRRLRDRMHTLFRWG